MTKDTVIIAVSCLSTFIISAGGCLTTAMVATGSALIPNVAVIVFATVTGLIAAARQLQAILSTPPGQAVSKTVETVEHTTVGPKPS